MLDDSPYSQFANVSVKDMPELIDRMLAVDPQQRLSYFELAKEVGVEAIPFLAELVNESDWEIRHCAVHTIGQLIEEHKATSDTLVRFTTDEHESVRHLAALYLVRLNQSTDIAVPILVGDLRENRESQDSSDYDEECVRIEIVSAFGNVLPATKEVLQELTKSLADPSLNVQLSAAQSLGKLGTSAIDSAPQLRSLLRIVVDEPPALTDEASRKVWTWLIYRLQSAAVEALFRIGNECHDAVLADILRDEDALCFAHHQALTILSTIPYSNDTRGVITAFAANSTDPVAIELSEAALKREA